MTTPRKRCTPAVGELEPRCLLTSNLTATWLGQDGVDLVGGNSATNPSDGVQDIDILLQGLLAGQTIASATILPYGGGGWQYNMGGWGYWSAAVVQPTGSTSAHLYIDPEQVETGRQFYIHLVFNDQSTADLGLAGGTATPALRMPQDALQVQWLGQGGRDYTGPGPSVGPDGIQDVDLHLSQLFPTIPITSITVTSSSGTKWQSGDNPGGNWNAEFIQNSSDPTQGDVYIDPNGDMSGQTLTVSVDYSDGRDLYDTATVTAGTTDPTLQMPAPAPVSLTWNVVSARWIGQDGQNLEGPGDVHVSIIGLPPASTVVSASLSDESRQSWNYTVNGATDPLAPYALPMVFKMQPGGSQADLDFPPNRSEVGATMTLRLVLSNGQALVTQFQGGPADPGLRAPQPAATSIVAHPGDDLNALANQYGSVHLSAGTYNLSQTLVLNNPVAITADPGTTLLFTQQAADQPWAAAIKINAGHTTLDGFAVRFAGPIRWNWSVNYSPAVIGVTDNLDPGKAQNQLKVDITLTHLDLQTPPPASSWEQAPSLMRLVGAQDGIVANNTLDGGTIEFIGGPWQIVDNNNVGTVAGTYSYAAFTGHYTHDVLIEGNTVQPAPGSGKTWRFLVMTQGGVGDLIENNTVVGVGPMDNDTVPNPNASEITLTESYRLHYEGMPSAISPDGMVLQIPGSQGGSPATGDIVAILSGPDAGQWRMISQILSPTAYLLDSPLPQGNYAISITQSGFVNETYQSNTIDMRGSSTAGGLILAGNQFGAKVIDNTLLGGGGGLALSAYPTEYPNVWGWSHAPFLGADIEGNTIVDSLHAIQVDVLHSQYTKTNQGRVYFSATLSNNVVEWTSPFLARFTQSGSSTAPQAISVGDRMSIDPGELVLTAQGNEIEVSPNVVPNAMFTVASGTINGQAIVNQATPLPTVPPAAPSGLRLLDDNGYSSSDGVTSDPRLTFAAVAGMAGYEYSLTGAPGSFQPVTSPSGFTPAGLSAGFNAVFVRAYDATGNRGQAEVIAFVYDPSTGDPPPSTGSNHLYVYRLGNVGSYVPLGTAVAVDPALLASGSIPLEIQTIPSGRGSNPPGDHTTRPPGKPAPKPPATPPPGGGSSGKKLEGSAGASSHAQASAGGTTVSLTSARTIPTTVAGPLPLKVLGHAWDRPRVHARATATGAGVHRPAAQKATLLPHAAARMVRLALEKASAASKSGHHGTAKR